MNDSFLIELFRDDGDARKSLIKKCAQDGNSEPLYLLINQCHIEPQEIWRNLISYRYTDQIVKNPENFVTFFFNYKIKLGENELLYDTYSLLYWAAELGLNNVVMGLIQEYPHVVKYFKNIYYITPLKLAVINGHTQIVKTFLDNGAEVSFSDIYFLSKSQNTEIPKLLANFHKLDLNKNLYELLKDIDVSPHNLSLLRKEALDNACGLVKAGALLNKAQQDELLKIDPLPFQILNFLKDSNFLTDQSHNEQILFNALLKCKQMKLSFTSVKNIKMGNRTNHMVYTHDLRDNRDTDYYRSIISFIVTDKIPLNDEMKANPVLFFIAITEGDVQGQQTVTKDLRNQLLQQNYSFSWKDFTEIRIFRLVRKDSGDVDIDDNNTSFIAEYIQNFGPRDSLFPICCILNHYIAEVKNEWWGLGSKTNRLSAANKLLAYVSACFKGEANSVCKLTKSEHEELVKGYYTNDLKQTYQFFIENHSHLNRQITVETTQAERDQERQDILTGRLGAKR